MEILVLTSNPKSTGALATLTDLVAQSARAAGASVEEIRLEDRQIGYCRFCMTCFRDWESPVGPCVQADDMPGLLERLRQADGYIFATPVSSGHANARFKTFAERCCYTAGRCGRFLWMVGPPESRFTDKARFAATVVTSGVVPPWLALLCDTTTREIAELARCAFNARVVGTLYAGAVSVAGLRTAYRDRAWKLGQALVGSIRRRDLAKSPAGARVGS